MDHEQFSLSYGGSEIIDDYFYNSPAGNVTNRTILMKTTLFNIFVKLDYYDLYDDEFDSQDQDEQSFWSHLSFYQLCTQCVLPAVWSTCSLLGSTLILCVLFRLFVIIGT